jgi:hypothetical protein
VQLSGRESGYRCPDPGIFKIAADVNKPIHNCDRTVTWTSDV